MFTRGIVLAYLCDVFPHISTVCEQDCGNVLIEGGLHDLRTRPVEDPPDKPNADEMLLL